MTATADLVIRGVVKSVEPGKTHHYAKDESSAAETDRVLNIQVDEVVFAAKDGRTPTSGSQIAVIEGWWSEGVGYQTEGMPWSEPGQTGYFFLAKDPGYKAGTYTYVGSSARALITAAGAEVSGDHHGDGPWDGTVEAKVVDAARRVAADTHRPIKTSEVHAWVRAAADNARRGVAAPMPRPAESDD